MPIDRDRFLRAALLLSLGGAPAAGCIVQTEGDEPPPEQTSGGEQPVMVRQGPAEEGAVAPAYEDGVPPPANEGFAPAYEGGYSPSDEGGPSYE